MRSYAMRTHTTKTWPGATISFYAASAGSNGGAYQLDNVVMGAGNGLSFGRTDCVDPLEPGSALVADGPELLTNGNFSNGLANWTPYGTITAQVTGGVAEFIRPSSAAPSGVLLQPSGTAVGAGQLVTATFQLGNSSSARKRITVLLHDFNFGDLAACTFWLPAGQPLQNYLMRTYTTQAWPNATVSFYPATTDTDQWFTLDNVSMKVTPSKPTFGADCVEPTDVWGMTPTAPAPMPLAIPAAASSPVPVAPAPAVRALEPAPPVRRPLQAGPSGPAGLPGLKPRPTVGRGPCAAVGRPFRAGGTAGAEAPAYIGRICRG
jgi:hypothetical protein